MDKNQLFGGNPVAVIVRLIILSVVVGIVLSALNIHPQNIVYHIRLVLQRIYSLGFGAIEGALGYFLLGAVVVVPIWLIARLFGVFRQRDENRRP